MTDQTAPDSTDTDRLAEIKARVSNFERANNAYQRDLRDNWRAGPGPDYVITKQELESHAREDIAHLLSLVEQLQQDRQDADLIAQGELIRRDKAIESLERALDEQRWYGEQLQASVDSCSGNHLPIEEYPEETTDA